ncbi:MAG: hypothetical protein JWR14_4039, partial [Caballeronia sp.]|nr:hypothetical protein [Caballeronia sp.]
HSDAVQSKRRTSVLERFVKACAVEMRGQPAPRLAVNKPLVEVAGQDHRHGRGIETLQHLIDLYPSFTRCQPWIRCDNTSRLSAAINVRHPARPRPAAPERQVERADHAYRKAHHHRIAVASRRCIESGVGDCLKASHAL